MDTQAIKIDLLTISLLHDLGKISYEYYLSKFTGSNIPDTHAHILTSKYPHLVKILRKATIWAPHLSYLDFMEKHHSSYTSDKYLNMFKSADRADRENTFSLPPILTRINDIKNLQVIDYLGNNTICDEDISSLQKIIVKHIGYLVSNNLQDRISVIQKVIKPILEKCPTDNRPGLALSIWSHSISVYLHLIGINSPLYLQKLSHPQSNLVHAYGELSTFCKLLPYYNTLLSASAFYLQRQLDIYRISIDKHLSHLPHTLELHRKMYIYRNIALLRETAKEVSPKEIEEIFRSVLGIKKPPSISVFGKKLWTYYMKLRYKYGYTHEGALFHIFYRRKMTVADVLELSKHRFSGPLHHLVALPSDKLSICLQVKEPPNEWIFSSKSHGLKMKYGIYLTSTPKHVLVRMKY